MQSPTDRLASPGAAVPAVGHPMDQSTTSGIRIQYLDSLRGLAALAVVVVHALEMFGLNLGWAGITSDALLTGGVDKIIPWLDANIVGWGAMAVELFIVLSGYSLMIAVAKSSDGKPKGGLRTYFFRRIRRIWPPYFGALLVSLLLIALIPGMNEKANVYWDLALPVTWSDILGHVFFLQHLNSAWFFKIDPPMWTVAIEEWIYVLFPFVLLPVWRRLGSLPMVAAGSLLGVVGWYLLPTLLGAANPGYLGLLAMGALGASLSFSRRPREARWRRRLPWLKISAGLVATFVLLTLLINRVSLPFGDITWLTDLIFGASVLCLLVHYTELWKAAVPLRSVSFLRILSQPVLISLGRFSYSLYLLHAPVLAVVALLIRAAGLTSITAYAAIVGLGVPAALLFAYLFHRVFERPFMTAQGSQLPSRPKVSSARVSVHL